MIYPWVYAWLTSYQQEGVRLLQTRKSLMLHWACGAGKTAASIVGTEPPVLIVTKAISKRQWAREIRKLSKYQPTILEGQTPHEIPGTATHLLISYEIVPYWVDTLLPFLEGHTLILDEIHKARNWRRKERVVDEGEVEWRLKANNISASIARLSKVASRRYGLTATPICNTRADLWSQLDILEPGKWGGPFQFFNRYCDAHPGEYGLDISGKSNCKELIGRMKALRHIVKRGEVNQLLPVKRRLLTFLAVSEQCRAAAFTKDLKAAKDNESRLEVRLAQAASRKKKYIKEVVQEALKGDMKVVVLTGRRDDCDLLAELLGGTSIHGGCSHKAIDEEIQSYMASPGPRLLISTYHLIGESLNLQDTDLALVAMLPYTPERVIQLEGRFARLGQSRAVLIEYIICEETIDEGINEVLLSRLEDLELLLGDDEATSIRESLDSTVDEETLIAGLLNKY